jgi:hypothetical protein
MTAPLVTMIVVRTPHLAGSSEIRRFALDDNQIPELCHEHTPGATANAETE